MTIVETGKTNAFKFVQKVNKKAVEGRVVLLYASDKNDPWPWMRNPEWQNLVLDQLEHQARVRDAQFHPADNVDGLCFTAISTAGESRIELLGLDETLDGRTPPAGRFARLKWIFTASLAVFR